MTTAEALQIFLFSCDARSLRPQTIIFYRENITRLVKLYPELPTNPKAIEHFLSTLSSNPNTRHKFWRALRAFFRFLALREEQVNPMIKLHPPLLPRLASKALRIDQLQALYQMVLKPRDRAMLTLLIDSGIRRGELVNLCWGDLGADFVFVRGKSGPHTVPISPLTARSLWSIRPTRATGLDRIFLGSRGPLTPAGITTIVHHIMAVAGIKAGPHALRHTFGTLFMAAGGDLLALKEIMGHATVKTTERYVDSKRYMGAQHRKFSPLNGLQQPPLVPLAAVIAMVRPQGRAVHMATPQKRIVGRK